MQKIIQMVRIVENNDWVIFTLLGLVMLYIMVFNWLQKEVSFKEYLFQSYDLAQNNVLTWILISGIFVGVLSLLLSQYVPIVPRFVADIDLMEFRINKIGFFFTVLSLYYILKTVLSLLFYKTIGQMGKYLVMTFIAQRFYFVESLLLLCLSIVHYYFPIDRVEAFLYYAVFMAVLFVGKILFYFFHKENPLPDRWYYKILYICTLQILPLLAVWKFIFL